MVTVDWRVAVVLVLLAFPGAANAQFGKFGKKILREGNLDAATKMGQAMTLTDKQMSRLGREVIAYEDSHNPVASENNEYAQRLRKLVAKHVNEDGLTLNFKVYMVSDFNAFAAPDGSIRVMAGLMQLLNDQELLSVIGHEIGHVKHKHMKKGYQKAYSVSAGRSAAEANTGVVSFIPESQMGDFVEKVLNAKFSRNDESEADEFGFAFLVKHGYDHHAMEMAFEKLAALDEEQAKQSLMATHPLPAERAEKARARAKAHDAEHPKVNETPTPEAAE